MLYDHSPEAEGRRLKAAAQEREAAQRHIAQQAATERRAALKASAAAFDAAEHARKVKAADDVITEHERALKEAIKNAYTAASGGNLTGFEESYPRLRAAWIEMETLRNAEVKPQTTTDVVRRTLAARYGG